MLRRTGFNLSRTYLNVYTTQKRYKNAKTHWSVLAKQKPSAQKALEYFDDLYGNLYGNDWPSIRVALLTQSKYVALVNNFSDTERIIPHLENLGAMDVRRVFECQLDRIESQPGVEKKRRKRANDRNTGDTRTDKAVESLRERLMEEELQSVYPSGAEVGATVGASSFDAASRLIERDLSGGLSALYEFVPATELKGKEDWVPESEHFQYYSTAGDCPVVREEQRLLEFPSELKVYSMVTGSTDSFPRPKKSSLLEVTDYYLMDGASILPIIALDLKPGDNFLDMCAAPGGKSLLALQTLYPHIITMNDQSISRSNRLMRVMKEFVMNFDDKLGDTLKITHFDGRSIREHDVYNKILVDAPCTTDRHSVMTDDNNIFKSARTQERIKIPELQSGLLASALDLVKVGGTVVYSTCSLSPIQNDGVVHMALKTAQEKSGKTFAIIDMTKALEPTEVMFRYRLNVVRYGHLVVPYLPDNYGPMYFCKMIRFN